MTKAGTTEVQKCIVQIRQMISVGELLPGQKVHQAEIANLLNTSRIPVREALSTLHAEGLLAYKANTGFTVSRFSRTELAEIYLMRQLLETPVLRSIDLTTVDLAEMERLHTLLIAQSSGGDVSEAMTTNYDFHFTLFNYSPLKLVVGEIDRLWQMSVFYRSLYVREPTAQNRVHHDHQGILDAIARNDADALVEISDEHRTSTEKLVIQRTGWAPS